MAVISKSEVSINRKRFKRVVRCDADGSFSCDLPTDIALTLEKKRVTGSSFEECVKKWERSISEHMESCTVRTKVIAYQVSDSDMFEQGIAVRVAAGVFEEVVTRGGNFCRIAYEAKKSSLHKEMDCGGKDLVRGIYSSRPPLVIDWTEEREAFFKRIGDALMRVQGELEKLHDPSRALEIIDGGKLLLEGGAP